MLNHTLDIHLKSTADDWNLLIGLEPTPINFVITPIERLLDTIVPDGFVEVVMKVQYTLRRVLFAGIFFSRSLQCSVMIHSWYQLLLVFQPCSGKCMCFIQEIEEYSTTEENTVEYSEEESEEESEGIKYQPTVLKSLPVDPVRKFLI